MNASTDALSTGALANSSQVPAELLDSIEVGIAVLDRNFNVQVWNKFLENHGAKKAEASKTKTSSKKKGKQAKQGAVAVQSKRLQNDPQTAPRLQRLAERRLKILSIKLVFKLKIFNESPIEVEIKIILIKEKKYFLTNIK